jgi:amino acid transporter
MNAIKNLIRNNLAGSAIVLYVIVFMLVQAANPSFLYNEDGSLREFGVGYSSKTVLPIWLIAILLGILSYLLVFYISRPVVRVML